jgi:hypothetical protein
MEQSSPQQTTSSREREAYKWNAAVCAHIDLRLIGIDEDPWVTQWAATSITLNNTLMSPPNWLLVNQADGRLGPGL